MARRFNKFGLRRDLNFVDIPNKESALNNILNGLVDIEGESFISADLDAIRNISNTTIENDDFRNITGAALQVTNSSGGLDTYRPIVKIKNRLDKAEFTVGQPSFYGGNGLTNKYYDVSQINSTATNVDDIFTGDAKSAEIFWENGAFSFQSKIKDDFEDIYGGIEWNGYFKPTISGIWQFTIRTRGFFTFELDGVLSGRKSQVEYPIQIQPAAQGSTNLTLSNINDVKNLMIGDVLSHPTIPQFADPDAEDATTVAVIITSIDRTTGVIGISAGLETAITTATTFTFRFRIGIDRNQFTFTSDTLERFKPYEIKIRFWIPNIPEVDSRSLKTIEMWISEPNFSNEVLNLKYLYDKSYNINPDPGSPEFGDFRRFYINRLNSSGGTIGGTQYADYQSIVSKAPANISYDQQLTLSSITKQTKTVTTTIGKNILPMSTTDNIEVGNYVFGDNIPIGTRVSDISLNNAIFLDQNATATASNVIVTFIEHRGLIAFDNATTYLSGSYLLTDIDSALMSQLALGDIVINSHTPTNTVITEIAAGTVKTSNAFSAAGTNVRSFFYSSKGLYDKSLDAYCAGVVAAPTVLQSNAGSNTLTLAYVNGISTGMVVQFGSRIQAATTVSSVNATTNVVTLSKTITDDIPIGQLITFAPAGTTDNKEICFPPLDTSPPFTANSAGLQTTSTRPTVEIKPVGGQGELKFVGLSADGVPVESILANSTYTKALTITDATGIVYRILGTL